MAKKYVVQLTVQERQRCLDLIRAGQAPARSIMHAQVLLKSDSGPDGPAWTDDVISQAFEVSTVTVAHIRQTQVTEGLDAALRHYQTGGREYQRKLDGHQEAQLVALACGPPPEGRVRWTLRLLTSRMVELGYTAPVSYNTVSRVLKKTNCGLGASCNGASRPTRTPAS
jgi:hypothetical protein